MIVFDRGRTSRAAAQLIADIAYLSGHMGKARDGIIQLRPRVNTQGLLDMGVKRDTKALREAVAAGKIKGLLLFGHDAPAEVVGNLDFLLVADTALNQAMPYADVILPLAGFGAVNGSFTSSEGKVQLVEAAIATPTGVENWRMIAGLVAAFPQAAKFKSLEQVRMQIADWYPAYRGVYLDGKAYTGPTGEATRCTMGYPFPDGLPRLMAQDTALSNNRHIEVEDISMDTWAKAKKHYGIVKEK